MTCPSPFLRLEGAILAAFLLIAACVPTSEHPIAVPGEPTVDPALLGTWRGQIGDEDSLLLFLDTREDADTEGMSFLLAAPVVPHEDADPAWIYGLALAAKVSDHRFLSIEWRQDGGKPVEGSLRGYHLYRYAIADGKLELFAASEAELGALHAAGRLEGVETGSGLAKELRITASSEALVALLGEIDPLVVFAELTGALSRLP